MRWTVEAEASAPSTSHVLKESGRGDFPWRVRADTSLADGYAEVNFKSLAGKDEQAGGCLALEAACGVSQASASASLFDGTPYIEVDDELIQGAGAVGVWTKADSVTVFDDLSFGANPPR